MPYEIRKVGKGYIVFTKGTKKGHSKKAMPLERAKAQMRALYANMKE